MALVKHTNNSLSNITALPSAVPTGKMTLLNTATASSSASLSFDSTYINSDYLIYKFEFIDIHPATNSVQFQVGFRDGGTNYDATKTTTVFGAYQSEAGDSTSLGYNTGIDLAQSTSYQPIVEYLGNDNDQSCSGSLVLYSPSSTTFVKHFIARTNYASQDDLTRDYYLAGYCNTTTAIDGVSFKMSSGNIDAGQIKLYGLGS